MSTETFIRSDTVPVDNGERIGRSHGKYGGLRTGQYTYNNYYYFEHLTYKTCDYKLLHEINSVIADIVCLIDIYLHIQLPFMLLR